MSSTENQTRVARMVAQWFTHYARAAKNCNLRKELMDAFTVDHLLSKLNSHSVKIMSCLSSIDDVSLPCFEKYLNPSQKKNIICIPLYDEIHFQGYTVNNKEHKITQIDSLLWDHSKNATSLQIAKILLENSKPIFESLFWKENNLMLTAAVYGL